MEENSIGQVFEWTGPLHFDGNGGIEFCGSVPIQASAQMPENKSNCSISTHLEADYTLSIWMKPDDAPNQPARVLGKGSLSCSNFGLWLSSDLEILAEMFSDEQVDGVSYMGSSQVLPVNEWSHTAVSYSKSSGALKIYFGGKRVASMSTAGAACVEQHQILAVGSFGFESEGFKGSLQLVRVYNKALEASIIRAQANQVYASQAMGLLGILCASSTQSMSLEDSFLTIQNIAWEEIEDFTCSLPPDEGFLGLMQMAAKNSETDNREECAQLCLQSPTCRGFSLVITEDGSVTCQLTSKSMSPFLIGGSNSVPCSGQEESASVTHFSMILDCEEMASKSTMLSCISDGDGLAPLSAPAFPVQESVVITDSEWEVLMDVGCKDFARKLSSIQTAQWPFPGSLLDREQCASVCLETPNCAGFAFPRASAYNYGPQKCFLLQGASSHTECYSHDPDMRYDLYSLIFKCENDSISGKADQKGLSTTTQTVIITFSLVLVLAIISKLGRKGKAAASRDKNTAEGRKRNKNKVITIERRFRSTGLGQSRRRIVPSNHLQCGYQEQESSHVSDESEQSQETSNGDRLLLPPLPTKQQQNLEQEIMIVEASYPSTRSTSRSTWDPSTRANKKKKTIQAQGPAVPVVNAEVVD